MARGPKPVKKPRASGGRKSGGGARKTPNHGSASLPHWETEDDIPDNDEDLFAKQRDAILLNADDRADDEDDCESIESDRREVLALSREEEDASEEDSDEEQGDVASEDEASDAHDQHIRKPLKAKKAPATAAIPIDDSDASSVSGAEDSHDDLDRGWGPNKRAYYNTNNLDDMDSDSEIDEQEARELELAEVKRIQARSRKGMVDEDFGLGEEEMGVGEAGNAKLEREKRRRELDEAPVVAAQDGSSHAQTSAATTSIEGRDGSESARMLLLARLQRDSPETIALAGEYADVVEELKRVEQGLHKATRELPDHPSIGLMHLHHRECLLTRPRKDRPHQLKHAPACIDAETLLTYLTTITYYFYLRTQPIYVNAPAKLAKHSVVGRLVKFKQALAAMEDLGFSGEALINDDGKDEAQDSENESNELAGLVGSESDLGSETLGDLEGSELDELLADEKENFAFPESSSEQVSQKRSGVRKAPANGDTILQDSIAPEKDKEAEKVRQGKKKRDAAKVAPLSSLATSQEGDEYVPDFSSSKGKKRKASALSTGSADVYGDPLTLNASDAQDKSARKRSLAFHAQQVGAASARREAAARSRLDGDADIPYRDRDRAREAVAQASANRAAKEQELMNGGRESAGLDAEAWGDDDERDWRDVMGVSGADDFGDEELSGMNGAGTNADADADYYDLVASSKRKAKKQKKENYEAEAEAQRIVPEEDVEPGSHRSINRQIEKNRGLTPRRPKSVRNPRVKKRLKFDKANKKLASTRAVYKGGQAALQGGYAGEASGITNVVKSRSFG